MLVMFSLFIGVLFTYSFLLQIPVTNFWDSFWYSSGHDAFNIKVSQSVIVANSGPHRFWQAQFETRHIYGAVAQFLLTAP
jgi:hypothetical protein